MSTFGTLFRVTTFGESHCKGVGAIVDGCPPSLELTEDDIQPQLTRRRPGQSKLTTPRDEKDRVTILSGTERGLTLGTPIGLFVPNENVRPQDYSEMKVIPRPGHADLAYQTKYGIRASSGGGRSSARETIGRVAAGAIAEKWLKKTFGTEIVAFVSTVGTVDMDLTVQEDNVSSHDEEKALQSHLSQGGNVEDFACFYTPSKREGDLRPRFFSRDEVDRVGTLVILRDPSLWKIAVPADGQEDTQAQKEADEAYERIFINSIELKHSHTNGRAAERRDREDGDTLDVEATPAYLDQDGVVYNYCGRVLHGAGASGSETTQKWSKDELRQWGSEFGDVVAVRCPHPPSAARMATLIRQVKAAKDSTGGVITCVVRDVPMGLGEPCFDKLEAKLAHAMLSLPATKGFEIGSGFRGVRLRGSQHNDPFHFNSESESIRPMTNHAGGTLGGISSGADLYFRVAIKPVSTIGRAQTTVDMQGNSCTLEAKGRHDPCVLPRTGPLVEAMTALVLADLALIQFSRTRSQQSFFPLQSLAVNCPEEEVVRDGEEAL